MLSLVLAALVVSAAARADAQRVVSLVPAVTEMLFAMGAGRQVVGVSSFDNYPPDAKTRVRVGGLLDPDVERILSLRPDLVVVYETQTDLRAQLERAGVPQFAYIHGGLADITKTIRAVGARVGHGEEAKRLAADLERRLDAVRAGGRGRPRVRTMLVFGREPLGLRNIYVSGGVGFLHDMLEAAGGENVFGDVARESAQVSVETIIAKAPEAIVELRYGGELKAGQIERERRVWDRLASVPAVRAGRVHLLLGDEFVLPGPRVAGATERLARALHPQEPG